MKFDDNESWRYSRWEGGSAGGCHAMTLPQTRDAPPLHPSSTIHPPSIQPSTSYVFIGRLVSPAAFAAKLSPLPFLLLMYFLLSSHFLPAFSSLPFPPSTAHRLATLSIRRGGRLTGRPRGVAWRGLLASPWTVNQGPGAGKGAPPYLALVTPGLVPLPYTLTRCTDTRSLPLLPPP